MRKSHAYICGVLAGCLMAFSMPAFAFPLPASPLSSLMPSSLSSAGKTAATKGQDKATKDVKYPKGVSIIPGPVLINDECVQPTIIPMGCLTGALLEFNAPRYYAEVVHKEGQQIVSPISLKNPATTAASDLVHQALSAMKGDAVERSDNGQGTRYKEVNIWQLGLPDVQGTMAGTMSDMCGGGVYPPMGGYIYKSVDDPYRWRSNSGDNLSALVCGLSGLPQGAINFLSSKIPGLGKALSNCAGSWGALTPGSGFSVQASDLVHGALVSYRALKNSGASISPTSDQMQFGLPTKHPCFHVGQSPFGLLGSWEDGVKGVSVFGTDPDTFLIVIWQQQSCCLGGGGGGW